MNQKEEIKRLVAAAAEDAKRLAAEIWEYAELPYEEEKSAAALMAALEIQQI